jgi:class 3 adenylate cyclase
MATVSDKFIRAKIGEELDKAESVWNKVGYLLEDQRQFFEKGGEISTLIPGFPFIKDGKPKVGNFIALVLDIRDSTAHLNQRISGRTAKASQLERVYYETTAVNTAGSFIIRNNDGAITEYLGDGFLALFQVKDESDPDDEVYAAHRAAKKCLSIITGMVNEILYERYQLPNLAIGIGMAYSKAVVTVVGTEDNLHPKAIGECVWRATKISDGRNQICIDDRLENLWPTDSDGTLTFSLLGHDHGFKSYKISK